jgi:transcriptional regulator GlxA family with amidase domain
VDVDASDPSPLASVLAAVATDPGGDHSATALATRLGVSERHLGRLFARHAGTTPARYVESVRVAAARQLLAVGAATVAEVAAAVGFGSAETMRRAFRRTVGITPGAARRGEPMSGSEGEVSLRLPPRQRRLERTQ